MKASSVKLLNCYSVNKEGDTLGFFDFFNKKKEKSKNVAKERLKLVLVHDRSDLSPQFLDQIKTDIIEVISKYAEIDEEELDVKVSKMKKNDKNNPTSSLTANIPIIKVKDRKELEDKKE